MAAEWITDLDDQRAFRILEAVTQARLSRGEQPPDWSSEPAERLSEAFGVSQPGCPKRDRAG